MSVCVCVYQSVFVCVSIRESVCVCVSIRSYVCVCLSECVIGSDRSWWARLDSAEGPIDVVKKHPQNSDDLHLLDFQLH